MLDTLIYATDRRPTALVLGATLGLLGGTIGLLIVLQIGRAHV
jgi:hypothetical protein